MTKNFSYSRQREHPGVENGIKVSLRSSESQRTRLTICAVIKRTDTFASNFIKLKGCGRDQKFLQDSQVPQPQDKAKRFCLGLRCGQSIVDGLNSNKGMI